MIVFILIGLAQAAPTSAACQETRMTGSCFGCKLVSNWLPGLGEECADMSSQNGATGNLECTTMSCSVGWSVFHPCRPSGGFCEVVIINGGSGGGGSGGGSCVAWGGFCPAECFSYSDPLF